MKLTKEIKIGNIAIGGNNPIAIQSMTNTKTADREATLAQIKALSAADTCPQCGAKISKGMVFCSGCGNKLAEEEPATEQVSFCGNCGAPISGGAAFCTACGQKIE